MRKRIAALALTGLLAAGAAHAGVATVTTYASLSAVPFTFAIGGGDFSFTADASIGGADVATGGSGLVTSFLGAVTDFEAGSAIDGSGLFGFSAFPTAAPIAYSAADDFIGLSYLDGAGATRYGFAEVDGPELVGYAYETTAGTTIFASMVPEPASMGVFGIGLLAVVGAVRNRTRL